MYAGFLSFDSMPQIGFAHRFYTNEINGNYGALNKSFEIAYIDNGRITIELYGEKMDVKAGSIIVLFRHLPFKISSPKGQSHSHCTVQAEFDYSFKLIDDNTPPPNENGILLPLIVPPCVYTEQISKDINYIANISSKAENELAASLRFLSIISRLNEIAKTDMHIKSSSAERITNSVMQYIDDNIDKNISLNEIAEKIGKSPNYINASFKKSRGITINRYINTEKIKIIGELIHRDELPFRSACERVGIKDVSYGYRLFKQYTGITPKEYLSITILER